MIYVGTCGYSYADWKGTFYPPAIRPADMLGFYARSLRAVEIDATYYRIPSMATFASTAARAPDGFRFSVKLPGSATPVAEPAARGLHPDVALLRRNIEPLVAAGTFAAALMQFPNSFHPTPAARERGIGWVNVDLPQFDSLPRPGADVTAPLAYVRFHGRNYRTWWKGDNTTRFDYEYSADELSPWADRLIEIAANPDVREVPDFFNNHRRGQAARNAQMFETMLRERFAAAVAPPVHRAEPEVEQLRFVIDPGPD